MIQQSNIVIEEHNGTYQIESTPSGMYIVWHEYEDGKWVGLSTVKTAVDAHKVIKAHEEYFSKLEELQ